MRKAFASCSSRISSGKIPIASNVCVIADWPMIRPFTLPVYKFKWKCRKYKTFSFAWYLSIMMALSMITYNYIFELPFNLKRIPFYQYFNSKWSWNPSPPSPRATRHRLGAFLSRRQDRPAPPPEQDPRSHGGNAFSAVVCGGGGWGVGGRNVRRLYQCKTWICFQRKVYFDNVRLASILIKVFPEQCDNIIIIHRIFLFSPILAYHERNHGSVGIQNSHSRCKEYKNRRCLTELHR